MPQQPTQKNYQPPKRVLEKYADVLVNFALNSGKGIRKDEVVQIAVPDIAKPLALELRNAVLKAGGHPMLRLIPTLFDKDFYKLANDKQLTFFPEKYLRARADLLSHQIGIIADVDPEELKEVDSKKIMKSRSAQYPFREWLFEKEHEGKFTWTVALWGTEAKAKIVGLTLDQYWQQIIKACFLDKADPIAQWRTLAKSQKEIQSKLNKLSIKFLKILGKDVNLTIALGPERRWNTGSGSNIPSFEHFTSPDWRGAEGWIRFNQPLYRFGNIVEGIELEFKNGQVSSAHAKKGEKVLIDMLAEKNADKVGEFSLTDKSFSRITHPMAETLFDENIGGPFGNMHIAMGMAYKDCYKGDPAAVSEQEWEKMGYNNSAVHTDIVSTTDREVVATLEDGRSLVIYKGGRFTL